MTRAAQAVRRRGEEVRRVGMAVVSDLRRRPLPVDQACAVLGTGRSGTTWLTELLASDQRTIPVFEPLQPRRTPAANLPSLHGFHVVQRTVHRPDLHRYLSDVFAGQVLNSWTLRDASFRQVVHGQRVLAKMIRFCGAAGWLEQHFPVVRTVALVRHPCAVVASMRTAAGRWRQLPSRFFRRYAEAAIGADLSSVLPPGHLSETERFATLWAADNVALLRDTTPGRMLFVGFEELIASPLTTMATIDQHLGLGIDIDAIDAGRASSTSGRERRPSGLSEVGRWRDRSSASDIDTVLRIVSALGIGWVTVDPFLDMDRHRAAHGILGA